MDFCQKKSGLARQFRLPLVTNNTDKNFAKNRILAGIGCFLGGMGTHPLLRLEPKQNNFFPTTKEVSLWKVTEYSLEEPGNSTTKTWAMFTGSPSPMPVEIGVSMTILASVTALSCFFRYTFQIKMV